MIGRTESLKYTRRAIDGLQEMSYQTDKMVEKAGVYAKSLLKDDQKQKLEFV